MSTPQDDVLAVLDAEIRVGEKAWDDAMRKPDATAVDRPVQSGAPPEAEADKTLKDGGAQ